MLYTYSTFSLLEFYKDKRVIITGASRGIGKQLAIQLSQLGAKCVCCICSKMMRHSLNTEAMRLFDPVMHDLMFFLYYVHYLKESLQIYDKYVILVK